MLHILLGILKVIGIILAVIVALILLLLLLILFVPIRYYGSGSKHPGVLQGKARITWLFGLIRFTINYEDGTMVQDIRIFGISLNAINKWRANRQKKAVKKGPSKPKLNSNTDHKAESTPKTSDNKTNEESKVPVECDQVSLQEHSESKHEVTAEESLGPEETVEDKVLEKTEHSSQPQQIPQQVPQKGAPPEKKEWLIKRIWKKLCRIWKIISSIPGKIAAFFRKICFTIKDICAKIGYWKDFLENEKTKLAISAVKKEIVRLFGHVRPRKLKGNVSFGFEDPSTTGQLLAVACVFYPAYGNHIQLLPDFEKPVLAGDLLIKGRIYTCVLLAIAWRLFWNKELRYVIHTIRHK